MVGVVVATITDRLIWQPSLLGLDEPSDELDQVKPSRRFLGRGAWVDTWPGAVKGSEALFDDILGRAPWSAHERPMYDRMVREPRLATRRWGDPPELISRMGRTLTDHYGCDLGVISANLYRNGDDSVAWHGDRVGRVRAETVVAILSLGAPRKFLLRPKGGGSSVRFIPLAGDLLVMGGACQRTWEHTVPKCASAGPRISVMFREAY